MATEKYFEGSRGPSDTAGPGVAYPPSSRRPCLMATVNEYCLIVFLKTKLALFSRQQNTLNYSDLLWNILQVMCWSCGVKMEFYFYYKVLQDSLHRSTNILEYFCICFDDYSFLECNVIQPTYRDCCDESVQRHAACCRWWTGDRPVSTGLDGGLRHSRPRLAICLLYTSDAADE